MNTIKNKLISWSLVLLGCAFALSSCSDDDEDSPYAGTDAHITFLSLTAADGTVYPASIIDNTLTVSVPANVSLSGAKVSYGLCEQASIVPDPAKVTDWNEEQLFRLISYNGQVIENYMYVIERKEVPSDGSVTLTTQAELDAFGEKQINVIEGNLVIGSAGEVDDPIMNLKPLSSLTKVKGNLILLSSYEGGNLVGLENVKELGGMMIGTQDNMATITTDVNLSLPAVKQIGDIIINSNSVKTLQLPSITSASRISVCSTNLKEVDLSSLAHCSGDFSFGYSSKNQALEKLLCPNLKEVAGNFTLQYLSTLTTVDFTSVESIGGSCSYSNLDKLTAVEMPQLSNFSGNLTLTNLYKAEKVNFPKITSVITFSATGTMQDCATKSYDFSLLEQVSGAFTFNTKVPDLETLSFPALKTIGGAVTFQNLLNVETLSLPELAETGGNITFSTINILKTFSLPKLVTTKVVNITMPGLESLDLSSLSSFTGMTLSLNNLKELTLPESLEDFTGSLTLNNLNSMEELRFPESVKTFNGTLTIGSNTNNACKTLKKVYGPSEYTKAVRVTLSTVAGTAVTVFESAEADGLVTMQNDLTYSGDRTDDIVITNIKAINGRLSLSSKANSFVLPELQTLASLSLGTSSAYVSWFKAPKLETVTGDFAINYMGARNYDLPGLKEIGGSFKLAASRYYPNGELTNLDAFQALTKVGKVEITYNTALTDFGGLANMIGSFTGTWTVNNNAYNPTLAEMKAGKYTKP